jgi:ABC-type multidrug transport system ATPase subunit
MAAIEIDSVDKSFGKIRALQDVSVTIEDGELFGFIGPDGAGKTTLFRIITTLIKPDSGRVSVLGRNAIEHYYELRALLGYMPGKFSLYSDLSVRENIDFFAGVFKTTLQENYELVEPIYSQLEKFENRLAGALSGGMKQKLALSCALIHKPKLLVLDEPTTGVDAVSRQEFWNMLQDLNKKGLTIIISTPYMDEAEKCERVALIDEGKIMQIDTPQNIVRSFGKVLYAVKAKNAYNLINALRDFEHTESVQPFGEYLHYIDKRDEIDTNEIVKYLESAGIKDVEMHKIEPVIEDSFIRLMSK